MILKRNQMRSLNSLKINRDHLMKRSRGKASDAISQDPCNRPDRGVNTDISYPPDKELVPIQNLRKR